MSISFSSIIPPQAVKNIISNLSNTNGSVLVGTDIAYIKQVGTSPLQENKAYSLELIRHVSLTRPAHFKLKDCTCVYFRISSSAH